MLLLKGAPVNCVSNDDRVEPRYLSNKNSGQDLEEKEMEVHRFED